MKDVGKQLYQYGRYIVTLTDKHIEDGVTKNGYAIINSDWNITESTTTYLYRAINLAQMFEKTVQSLLKEEEHDEYEWPETEEEEVTKHGPFN